MSDFDYALDVDKDNEKGAGDDSYENDNLGQAPPPPMPFMRRPRGGQIGRNVQYSEAYGNYKGGYGPGGGYGPINRNRTDKEYGLDSGYPKISEYGPDSGYPKISGYDPVTGYGPGSGFGPDSEYGFGSGFGPGSGFGAGGWYGPVRFRPYPPGPNRSRGFGAIGQLAQRPVPPPPPPPPVHKGAKLLEKCEISPEYIKPLPRQLLDMIGLEYCGLCAQHFESFAMAKIHYNCKNHYKAQKKFLALHKSCKYNVEIPMKARSLYCELCDVQITSQSHADSHYAGKSHRAIVDGRKAPKNPILLQPGMEPRVDQLIRREKKQLKSAPETVGLPEEKAPEEKKIASSELFCDICKTTVTCSEQMTSHLNGKRHLTKEKQHILKMMKGEADKKKAEKIGEETVNDTNAFAEVAEVVQTEAEDQIKTDDDTENQVDDWSTGGGFGWDTQTEVQG